jgi:hypothetical protein
MAYGDIKRLNSQSQQLAATVGVIYTAPSGKRAQIATIILHNTTSAAKTVKLYSGGSTAAARDLSISLDGSETYEFSPKVPIVLDGGQALQGEATAASEINIIVYGRVED